jgi:hypothetical protein
MINMKAPPEQKMGKILHVAKRELALDDNAYRALLWAAEVESASRIRRGSGTTTFLPHSKRWEVQPDDIGNTFDRTDR